MLNPIATKALSILLSLAVASTVQANSEESEAKTVQNIAQTVILKSYKDLAQSTSQLATSCVQFAQKKTVPSKRKAQSDWKEARAAWEHTEAFLFGPVDALSVDPMMDSWPINTSDIEKVIQSKDTLEPELLENLGESFQGFHVIEYFLFAKSNNLKPREQQYLTLTCQALKGQSDKLLQAWTKNHNPEDAQSAPYINLISNPETNNPFFNTNKAVLIQLLQSVTDIVTEASAAKILEPLGATLSEAQPALFESSYSQNSLTDLVFNMYSVLSVYNGQYSSQKGLGLQQWIALKYSEQAQLIQKQIRDALVAIQAIPGVKKLSLEKASVDPEGRKRALAAAKTLETLQATLEQTVILMNK
ncbi:MAG: imelysin family protein [Pseudobdellovibrionaceae bacterium]